MKVATYNPGNHWDALTSLRSFECVNGNFEHALHHTRQQALTLRRLLPGSEPPADLTTLADTAGVSIKRVLDMPVPGIAFRARGHWHIHINERLSAPEAIRVALHELKHIIDHPRRARQTTATFDHDDYELLATRFADDVLTIQEPALPSA